MTSAPPLLLTLARHTEPHHAPRVAQLARSVDPTLGLNPDHAHTAGLLHDLGKLAVNPALLHAPRPLTPEERTHLHRHPHIGAHLTLHHWPTCPRDILHASTTTTSAKTATATPQASPPSLPSPP